MNLQDIATIIGIASIFITGANFVIISIAKSFWSLTYKKTESRVLDIERKLGEIEDKLEKESKENEAFRHKYKTTVDTLFLLIESKFQDFDKSFISFKELIITKIELAIARNNEDKKNAK